jgi:diguanylate cyclase (GGDEF)-like protein
MTSPQGTAPPATDALHARLTSPTRLAALRASGLLDGAANPVLDRLSRLVTTLLGVPVALVSLVDDRRQHFAGLAGLGGWAGEERGTPLSHSFCQHVVASDATLLVGDASAHPLVRENLAFTELGVMAYAGVPLRTAEGETLGALCAIDTAPCRWRPEHVAVLEDLAAAAMAEIELRSTSHALVATQDRLLAAHERLREQSVRDELTGLLNRRGFGEQARQHLALAQRTNAPFLVVAMDLDGFKAINDTLGHDAGDEALVEMAVVLTQTCRASDAVARMGGDEFVALLTNAGAAEAELARARLRAAVAARNAMPDRDYALATSIGIAAWQPDAPTPLAALLRDADQAMYEDKRARRAAQAAGRRAAS